MNKMTCFLTILILSFSACKAPAPDTQNKAEGKEQLSSIEFEEKSHDYGNIEYESDGTCSFSFTNTSRVPLVINRVITSCGCTSPQWPREPIKKGNKGEIGVTYNTRITGNFRKVITVYSNAENSPHKLIIEGNVEKDKETAKD